MKELAARDLLLLAFGTARAADEETIVNNILGPEGPLYIDGNLYFVGWVSNTLSKWDGKSTVVLNHTAGCGHNGLALTMIGLSSWPARTSAARSWSLI